MNDISNAVSSSVAIVTAIIGLAIVAVILSPHSSTSNVIGAGGNFFQVLIRKAVAPVSA